MAFKIHGKDERENGKLKDKKLREDLKAEAKRLGLPDNWEPELITPTQRG